MPPDRRRVALLITVAALGYFVDIYDLILFAIVRTSSLRDLGVPAERLLDDGIFLLNMQMGGMLVGGILWGMLGDKRGRVSVLFGSIVLYSVANVANGLIDSFHAYAVVRFIAGVGLAGELGAGITLVSEVMSKEARGYGTAIIAGVGIGGAVAAVLVGDRTHWRTAYFIGGGLGFALLALRMGAFESGMFASLRDKAVSRGDFMSLLTHRGRLRRYVSVILIGVPIWYLIGILVAFCPEIGKALGMVVPPTASRAVFFSYIGLFIGDLGSGVLSQLLRSRKKVIGGSIVFMAALIVVYFTLGPRSLSIFYACCLLLGVSGGYWAVFVTVASEQFGTNVRATVTTSAPNFVRGAVVPMTSLFALGKTHLGVPVSAALVGVLVMGLALVALRFLDETYGKDLDYVEG